MKKKLIATCLLGLIVLGGSNVFAATQDSSSSISGSYWSAYRTGTSAVSVAICSDNGISNSNRKAGYVYTSISGKGAIYLTSAHVWIYPAGSNEMDRLLYLK